MLQHCCRKRISLTNSRYLSSRFISHPINTLPDNARCVDDKISDDEMFVLLFRSKIRFTARGTNLHRGVARVTAQLVCPGFITSRDCFSSFHNNSATFCAGFRCRTRIYCHDRSLYLCAEFITSKNNSRDFFYFLLRQCTFCERFRAIAIELYFRRKLTFGRFVIIWASDFCSMKCRD